MIGHVRTEKGLTSFKRQQWGILGNEFLFDLAISSELGLKEQATWMPFLKVVTKYVPAVAVTRIQLALFKFIGCKVFIGC